MRRATIKKRLGVRFEFDGEMIKVVYNILYTALLYGKNYLFYAKDGALTSRNFYNILKSCGF